MTTVLCEKKETQDLSDAQVGDVVEFFYYGNGDHCVQVRQAKVIEVDCRGILGKDLTYGGIKRFNDNESRDVFVLDAVKEVIDFVLQNGIPIQKPGNAVEYIIPKKDIPKFFKKIKHKLNIVEKASKIGVLTDSDEKTIITVYPLR